MTKPHFQAMASKRQVLLHKDEDGWWIAEVPSLPGCVSQGKSKAEAVESVKEAIQCHVEALESLGKPVPEDDYQQAALVVVG